TTVPTGTQGAIDVQQQLAQTPQQPRRVTATFNETPIHDVLATFSDYAGKSIVAGAGVTGAVSAEIKDQPWDVALNAILQSQGLAARESETGIIVVDKIANIQLTEKTESMVTQEFRIRSLSADSILPALLGVKSDSGKTAVAKGTNTLIVTDRPSVMVRVAHLIAQLDQRTPQVSIAAKI